MDTKDAKFVYLETPAKIRCNVNIPPFAIRARRTTPGFGGGNIIHPKKRDVMRKRHCFGKRIMAVQERTMWGLFFGKLQKTSKTPDVIG
jgi:hypothetical protein